MMPPHHSRCGSLAVLAGVLAAICGMPLRTDAVEPGCPAPMPGTNIINTGGDVNSCGPSHQFHPACYPRASHACASCGLCQPRGLCGAGQHQGSCHTPREPAADHMPCWLRRRRPPPASQDGTARLGVLSAATAPVSHCCYRAISHTRASAACSVESDDISDLPAGTKIAEYGPVNQCSFDGTVVIGGPLSLTKGDNFYPYGMMIQRTLMIFADWVNGEKGGLRVGDQRYGVRFVWVDDRSSSAHVANSTARALRSTGADFGWAGYGSGPSRVATQQAYAEDKLFFAGCASSPTVFSQNDQTFGTLPPVSKFLLNPFNAIKAAAEAIDADAVVTRCGRDQPSGCAASLKVGFIQAAASFTRGICSSGEANALARGMDVSSVGVLEVAKAPTVDDVKTQLEQLIADGVNVLVGCTYESTGRAIIAALEELDFSPFALITTSTVTQPSYYADVITNDWWQGEYVLGPTPWHRNSPVVGEFSGKTSTWFFEEYKARFEDSQVAYQGVSNFGLACALGAAIEAAGTLEKEAVKAELNSLNLQEFYGQVEFQESGQVDLDMIVVQYAPNKEEEDIVYPSEAISDGEFLFPTPTWAQRRCWYTEKIWALERNNQEDAYECDGSGACNEEGTCTCNEGYSGSHCEVASVLTECPAGTYAIQMEPLVCEDCPASSVSAPGSTSMHDCTPRLQVEWVPCEPCATQGGEDCEMCPSGYVLSSSGAQQYEDYDECAINHGGCDPLARVGGICTNVEGSFACGQCPPGFLGSGSLATGGCVLPHPEVTDGGVLAGSPVIPTLTIAATAEASALDNSTDYIGTVRSSLADALNITGNVMISNLRTTASEGRRLQSDDVSLLVDVGIAGETGPASMWELQRKLQDADFCSNMSFVEGQSLTVSYNCPIGMVRPDGQTLCGKCPWPEHTPDQANCLECPLNMIPTAAGDACVCKPEYYSATTGEGEDEEDFAVMCYATEYDDLALADPGDELQQCRPCGEEVECVSSCQGLSISIKPGWMSKSNDDSTEERVFACMGGEAACPGGPAGSHPCGEGYSGLLCSICAPGYHVATGNKCSKCESMTPAGAALTVVSLIIAVLLAWKVKVWYNYFTIFVEISAMLKELDLKSIFKQFAAAIQILSGLGPVLDIVFPAIFSGFLGKFANWFKFDISVLIGVGCYTVNSYITSLCVNFATVMILALVVLVVYKVQLNKMLKEDTDPEELDEQLRNVFDKFDKDKNGINKGDVKKIVLQVNPDVTDQAIDTLFAAADADGGGFIDFDEFRAAVDSEHTEEFSFDDLVMNKMIHDTRSDAIGRLFLCVFIMYPGLTNKIFEGFMCRDLGDVAVLHSDYTTECYTASWYATASLCGVLGVLWPIGLPALLYFSMRKDLDLIKSGDEDTLKFWDFAIGDYGPDHWYWEVVELLRKMIMVGAIGLLGRGSIAQVFGATLISFGFFAYAIKIMPFKSGTLNAVKIFSELQLFVILLSCLVLQTDTRGLVSQTIGTRQDFGMLQLGITVASFPLVIYIVGFHMYETKDLAKEHIMHITKSGRHLVDEDGSAFQNPMIDKDDNDDEGTD